MCGSQIGKAYEVMHDERGTPPPVSRGELRVSAGLIIELEITEYQPGRKGLGPGRVDCDLHR
jgi:hypothetical protein